VSRRCLGKNLAFAEIQTLNNANHHDDVQLDATVAVIFLKSGFRDTPTSTPFPAKNSALPFGATVQLIVAYHRQEQQQSKSSLTNTAPSWKVLEWNILQHPHQDALQVSAEQGGGISCTKYLRNRREAFVRVQDPAPTTLAASPAATATRFQERREKSHVGMESDSRSVSQTTAGKDGDYHQKGDHSRAKALRAKIFASWLLENVLLGDGTDAVLDIAGGKGHLSMELAALHSIPCTVVDPLARKRPKMKRLVKLDAPVPRFMARPFVDDKSGDEQINEESTDDSLLCILSTHSCLVGLHPDECTNDIVDAALRHNKSVAVVPCCVFPTLFPARQLHSGRPVNSYTDFLLYLLEKDPRLQRSTLPFDGKNEVVYLKVASESVCRL